MSEIARALAIGDITWASKRTLEKGAHLIRAFNTDTLEEELAGK
jgi:hypothetical protein